MEEYYKQLLEVEDCNIPLVIHDPLYDLKEEYKNCTLCCNEDKCFGLGHYNPLIMFIGGQPSNYEVENGIFSDKVGQKIQGLIAYLSNNLDMINNYYMTNLVLCNSGHSDKCSSRLAREIQAVNPKNIILLGSKKERLVKHVIEIDKFYSVFVTRSLKELFYKRDEYKGEIKEDLDFFINNHE